MKKVSILFFVLFSFFAAAFAINAAFEKETVASTYSTIGLASTENWYICAYCCKTKRASSTPREQGCRVSSSGTHNYQFSGVAGSINHTCRNCDAELFLKQGTGPSASKCCATGGTHNWYYK